MTYIRIDLWITSKLFTGSQRVAVAGAAAAIPPLLAAAGATDAAHKHISP